MTGERFLHSNCAIVVLLACVLASSSLFARKSVVQAHEFSAKEWFAKREAQTREAMRLKKKYFECLEKISEPAQNLSIPVENHSDGSVKTLVTAQRAQFFLESGCIWGEGVVVRQYSENGEVLAEIFAENCLVDRKARCGWAEGKGKVVHGKTEVTGSGVYFSMSEEYIAIFEGTEIVSKDLKLGGIRL